MQKIIFITLSTSIILLSGCTISFQNIDSVNIGGEQTDTVEEEQSPNNDIKPNIELPKVPL